MAFWASLVILKLKKILFFFEQLLDYLINILDFLEQSQLSDEELNSVFYQFTSKQVLDSISMIDSNDKSKKNSFELRLYNSDYMNDPKEGDYLFSEGELTHRNESSNYKLIENSKIYLASFSKIKPYNEESLPMWNTYGQNHHGVSLGLRISVTHDSTRTNISKSIPDKNVDEPFSTTKHVNTGIYKVTYSNDEEHKELIDKIKAGYRELTSMIFNKPNLYEDVIRDI